MEKGIANLNDEKWSDALSLFREVLNTSPNSKEAKLGIAEAFIGLKNYLDAKTLSTSILQGDEENTHALRIRGTAIYYLGELPAALKIFSNILQLDPDNTKVSKLKKIAQQIERLKESGNKEFKDGRYEDAIRIYTEALALDPNLTGVNKLLYSNRATARKSLKKYDEAIDDLSKAIELDQEYIKAYSKRAQCFIEVGRYEEAERDFNMVVLKDPQDREAKKSLAEAKKLRKMAARKDYYKILGVDRNFSEPELNKAYRKRCFESHPDRKPEAERPEAEKLFKEVQEAYEILKDARKRQAYDAGADLEEINTGEGFHGHGGVDLNEIFTMFGQQQNGGGFRTRYHSGNGNFPF
jgi:DnaJ family protein C protein 7